MLNRIWAGMIVVSVLCAVLLGRMGELSQAILEGSQRAVTLTISMTGMMCAWTGCFHRSFPGCFPAAGKTVRPCRP